MYGTRIKLRCLNRAFTSPEIDQRLELEWSGFKENKGFFRHVIYLTYDVLEHRLIIRTGKLEIVA